jgi:hypothetical protein
VRQFFPVAEPGTGGPDVGEINGALINCSRSASTVLKLSADLFEGVSQERHGACRNCGSTELRKPASDVDP